MILYVTKIISVNFTSIEYKSSYSEKLILDGIFPTSTSKTKEKSVEKGKKNTYSNMQFVLIATS